MRSALAIFILVLVLFEIAILFPKNHNDEPSPKTETHSQVPSADITMVQQKMGGIHLVESQRGNRDWELFSESAQSYQGKSDWDLEGVKIHFYNSEVQDMTVTGKKGRIHSESKNMRIEGKVEVSTANGYVFLAPYIEYRASERLILCDEQVLVRGPNEGERRSLFLKATGMRIPVTERKMYLEKNVTGEKLFPDQKVLKFSSQRAELLSSAQTAILRGQVTIQQDLMTIKSENASFTYSEKTRLFESLDLQGKVELREQSRRALSENLKVDFVTKQFTFSGKPRLYQGDDELIGDKIIFLDNGKRVKVEKVKARGADR